MMQLMNMCAKSYHSSCQTPALKDIVQPYTVQFLRYLSTTSSWCNHFLFRKLLFKMNKLQEFFSIDTVTLTQR